MYLRAAHAEHHIPTLQRFIRENPLGLFITALPGSAQSFPTIQATHIPWVLDLDDEEADADVTHAKSNTNTNTTQVTTSDAPETSLPPRSLGILRGHLARQNPHSKALIEAAGGSNNNSSSSTSPPSPTDTSPAPAQAPAPLSAEVSIIFTHPSHHYITPKFYTTTKPTTGKVVPTWNYAAVQAYGRATVHHAAKSRATQQFLARQIADLSLQSEMELIARQEQQHHTASAKPWAVQDAPAAYIDILAKNIIGVEVEITRLEGKWKMSQELVAPGDRDGVVEGLTNLKTEGAAEVARLVTDKGRIGVKS